MPKLAPLPNTEAKAQFNDWLEKLAVSLRLKKSLEWEMNPEEVHQLSVFSSRSLLGIYVERREL